MRDPIAEVCRRLRLGDPSPNGSGRHGGPKPASSGALRPTAAPRSAPPAYQLFPVQLLPAALRRYVVQAAGAIG
jgi:hypothetical protein